MAKHERGTRTTYPRPDYRKDTTDTDAIAESAAEGEREGPGYGSSKLGIYRLSDMHGTMNYRLADNSGTATAQVTSGIRYGDGTDSRPPGEPFKWALNGKGVSLKVTQAGLDIGNWWPQGGQPDGPGTMCVTIRDSSAESGWGDGLFRPVTRLVTILACCPRCGGPRGVPRGFNNAEDGAYWWTNVWTNPCGHVDMYEAVVKEARERGTLGPARIH